MKRFFFVFSILMIVFLVLMAGCLAIAEYGAIDTYKLPPFFFRGWGVTLIPYHGEVIYPNGDVFFIKQASIQELQPGTVILFYVKDRKGIMSGQVAVVEEGQLVVNGADGSRADVPAGDIVGKYDVGRIPMLGGILGMMRSPIAIGVFAAALVASVLLWRLLPSRKPVFDGLSPSDSEIASILY